MHLFTEEHLDGKFFQRFGEAHECLLKHDNYNTLEYAFLKKWVGTDYREWHIRTGYVIINKHGELELEDCSQEVFPNYRLAHSKLWKMCEQGWYYADQEAFNMATQIYYDHWKKL